MVIEGGIIREFDPVSVNKNSHGIEITESSGDVLRINNDGTVTYIPHIRAIDGGVVYNTALSFGAEVQIISTKSALFPLTDTQIDRINSIGGAEVLDNTSFRIGRGGSIDSSFIERFNKNVLSKKTCGPTRKTRRGRSIRTGRNRVTVIYDTIAIEKIKTLRAVTERGAFSIISDPHGLIETCEDIGISYSILTRRNGRLIGFESSSDTNKTIEEIVSESDISVFVSIRSGLLGRSLI